MNWELILEGYIIINALLLAWYVTVPNNDKTCLEGILLLLFGCIIAVVMFTALIVYKIVHYFISELSIISYFKFIFTAYYDNLSQENLIALNNRYGKGTKAYRLLLKLINKRNNYEHI